MSIVEAVIEEKAEDDKVKRDEAPRQCRWGMESEVGS